MIVSGRQQSDREWTWTARTLALLAPAAASLQCVEDLNQHQGEEHQSHDGQRVYRLAKDAASTDLRMRMDGAGTRKALLSAPRACPLARKIDPHESPALPAMHMHTHAQLQRTSRSPAVQRAHRRLGPSGPLAGSRSGAQHVEELEVALEPASKHSWPLMHVPVGHV